MVVAQKFNRINNMKFYPVVGFLRCCIARTVFLDFHLNGKTSLINRHAFFAADQFRQVEREAKRIVERKGIFPVNFCFIFVFGFCNNIIK